MHVNALRRWTAFPSSWIRFMVCAWEAMPGVCLPHTISRWIAWCIGRVLVSYSLGIENRPSVLWRSVLTLCGYQSGKFGGGKTASLYFSFRSQGSHMRIPASTFTYSSACSCDHPMVSHVRLYDDVHGASNGTSVNSMIWCYSWVKIHQEQE